MLKNLIRKVSAVSVEIVFELPYGSDDTTEPQFDMDHTDRIWPAELRLR